MEELFNYVREHGITDSSKALAQFKEHKRANESKYEWLKSEGLLKDDQILEAHRRKKHLRDVATQQYENLQRQKDAFQRTQESPNDLHLREQRRCHVDCNKQASTNGCVERKQLRQAVESGGHREVKWTSGCHRDGVR